MGAIIPLIGMAVGSAVVGKVLAPKPPKPVVPTPQVQVRSNSAVADALADRRGSAVNQRTGARGAEALGGLKTKLGQ